MGAKVKSEQGPGLSQWREGGCPMSGKREATKEKERKDQDRTVGQSR